MEINRFNLANRMFVLVAIFAVVLAASLSTAAAGQTVGVLTSLSGKNALLGKQLELGVRLAADRHPVKTNAANIALEVRDSACKAGSAKLAAQDLLQHGVKIVIGPLCTEALYAALEVLSPKGVAIIAPYIRASKLDEGRKSNNWQAFTLAGPANEEAENISRILLQRWQGRPYAIVDDGGIYGRGLADDFRAMAELSGQKPVAVASFRPLQSNQIAMLRQLARSNIEALFVGGDADDIAQIARDAEKLGLDIEIVGGESLIMLPFVDDPSSVPSGILAILQLEPDLLPGASDLTTNLKLEGISGGGALVPGYGLFEIAAEALSFNNSKLEGHTFDTILGPVTFGMDGRAGAFTYRLHVWKDQQIKPLGGF